jgi:AcrR family transcriptional regulator
VVTTERKTKAERREEIVDAAMAEFAERGYNAASTEDIARRAGISQPYVFRLFGTKKELFRAVVARCFRETLEMFQRASEGKRGKDALEAMGNAYVERYLNDRVRLRAQMQAYAACDDDDIREAVRQGYGDLVAYVERVSGLPSVEVTRFFATGMLLNVLSSMELTGDASEPWAERLLEGCEKPGRRLFFSPGGK